MMDKATAIAEIEAIFGSYTSVMPSDSAHLNALNNGKLYELYVLSELIQELDGRGFRIFFHGANLEFKGAAGMIKMADPHFRVRAPSGNDFWIFVDIEFLTLGSASVPVGDYSGFHELDIVVVSATPPHPKHDDIALAIECKCVATFEKKLIKEALGIRRELSFLRSPQPSTLTLAGGASVMVAAKPPSEFWLAFIDPAGNQYQDSPGAFGIRLVHIEP
jgi:hypothetical protein